MSKVIIDSNGKTHLGMNPNLDSRGVFGSPNLNYQPSSIYHGTLIDAVHPPSGTAARQLRLRLKIQDYAVLIVLFSGVLFVLYLGLMLSWRLAGNKSGVKFYSNGMTGYCRRDFWLGREEEMVVTGIAGGIGKEEWRELRKRVNWRTSSKKPKHQESGAMDLILYAAGETVKYVWHIYCLTLNTLYAWFRALCSAVCGCETWFVDYFWSDDVLVQRRNSTSNETEAVASPTDPTDDPSTSSSTKKYISKLLSSFSTILNVVYDYGERMTDSMNHFFYAHTDSMGKSSQEIMLCDDTTNLESFLHVFNGPPQGTYEFEVLV